MSHDLSIQVLNTMIGLDGSSTVDALWHRLDIFEEQRDLRKVIGTLSVKGYIEKRDNVYWVTDKGRSYAEKDEPEYEDEEEKKVVVGLIREPPTPVEPMPLPGTITTVPPMYTPPRPTYVPVRLEAPALGYKKPNQVVEESGKIQGRLAKKTAIGKVAYALWKEPDKWFNVKLLKILTGLTYVNVHYAVNTLTSYSRKGRFPINYALMEGKGYDRKIKWSGNYSYPFEEKLESDAILLQPEGNPEIELEIEALKVKKKEIEGSIRELTKLLRSKEDE